MERYESTIKDCIHLKIGPCQGIMNSCGHLLISLSNQYSWCYSAYFFVFVRHKSDTVFVCCSFSLFLFYFLAKLIRLARNRPVAVANYESH